MEECAPMKTRFTLRIEANLLREARALAALQGSSLSALLTCHLKQLVRERKEYCSARKSALAMLRKGFDLNWTPASSRDELHLR